ncbi:MAG: ATP-binding cassette domain-containing protein [Lachnospiraceae bacterium]|nr:ATP-binding cassette domain-containing protein [Lachnospiraceae bacterium]
MANAILEVANLTKSYGSFNVLENVNIVMKKGHIYGFIGENGSGKTTLMRILTGLAFQDAGRLSIYGKENLSEINPMRKRIGSIIEMPALYPQYTAYRNLELQRILMGNPDKSVCSKLLGMVGLGEVRHKKVKTFSMGMKQRLSIALALVGKPDLLILDEPINGLDPKNIAQLRSLLKKLNEEHKVTMLISSHILSELYLLATDYIIIHKGHVIEELSHTDLEAKCRKYIQIQSDNLPKCSTVLEKELGISDYRIMDDHTMRVYEFVDKPQKISYVFMDHGIVVSGLSVSEQTIEEYFLSVTGGGWNNEPAKD